MTHECKYRLEKVFHNEAIFMNELSVNVSTHSWYFAAIYPPDKH